MISLKRGDNMNKEKISILELTNEDDFLKQLKELVLKSLKQMKGNELLIINRQLKGGFYSIFRDAFYDYQKGVILLERFFKKQKCSKKEEGVKTFSEKDKALLQEFNEFSKSIPNVVDLTLEEREEYTEKINKYLVEINQMSPEILTYDYFSYKSNLLMEFDDIEDEVLENISGLLTGMSTYLMSALTWISLSSTAVGITTIEYADYVDMVLMPILTTKNGEN